MNRSEIAKQKNKPVEIDFDYLAELDDEELGLDIIDDIHEDEIDLNIEDLHEEEIVKVHPKKKKIIAKEFKSDDILQMYLRDVGRKNMLTATEEIETR